MTKVGFGLFFSPSTSHVDWKCGWWMSLVICGHEEKCLCDLWVKTASDSGDPLQLTRSSSQALWGSRCCGRRDQWMWGRFGWDNNLLCERAIKIRSRDKWKKANYRYYLYTYCLIFHSYISFFSPISGSWEVGAWLNSLRAKKQGAGNLTLF